MDIRISPEVEGLFAKYESYCQQFDYNSIAKLYCRKLIVADPNGFSIHSNNLITRWQFEKAIKTFYEQAGITTNKILQLTEDKISEQYSLVKVSWEATFVKTRSQLFEFHLSYIVKKRKGKAEIIMVIAHEDEKKVLQGYGILNSGK